MWVHFEFKDGSNPYISTNDKTLFWMLRHYEYEQIGAARFRVIGEKVKIYHDYNGNKNALRDIATQWQKDFFGYNCSWGDVAFWEGFFYEYGRRYGLVNEFHENGIC